VVDGKNCRKGAVKMIFTETELPGAYIIEPELIRDQRGYFARTFCREEFLQCDLCSEFIQCSTSFNIRRGTLRGMHYQKPPYSETKLVRCISGAIFDVIIDLRPQSKTFKKWISVELSQENRKMLYIPEQFAHGFLTLEDDTELEYQISCKYVPESAAGVRFDDPAFGIKWPSKPSVISDRDLTFPLWQAHTFA
jgi:dTDP-4-dehydrorhamnose 3,5-epimerase